MDNNSSTPSRNQDTRFPPKRGQIKAQIFESFTSTVVSMASKVGEALSRIKEGGTSSAPTSSPPSSYNSDGN